MPCTGRNREYAIAELTVNADERLQIRGIDQVDFVDADDWPHAHSLCSDQEPIDQVRFQIGFGGTADDEYLVDIGHQNVLAVATRATENAMARFDAFDDTFIGTLWPKPNVVARGHDV